MASANSIQVAQAVGIAAVTFSTGITWAISYFSIPSVLAIKSPKDQVLQWKTLFDRGFKTGPPFGILATTSLAYAAYLMPDPALTRIYSVAAVFPMLIVPYTWIFMNSTNAFLNGKARAYAKGADQKPQDQEQVSDYIKKWRDFNYARSGMPAVGMLLAVFATTLAGYASW